MLTAAAATAAESFSPAIPTRAVRQTAGLAAQSAVRFDRTETHLRTTEKRTNKGTCAYCGTKNSAVYECADCKIPLHFPGGQFQWPCSHNWHDQQYRNYCYGDHTAAGKKAADFVMDPAVARIREEVLAQQKSPPQGRRRSFEVVQTPNDAAPKTRRQRTATAVAVAAAAALALAATATVTTTPAASPM